MENDGTETTTSKVNGYYQDDFLNHSATVKRKMMRE